MFKSNDISCQKDIKYTYLWNACVTRQSVIFVKAKLLETQLLQQCIARIYLKSSGRNFISNLEKNQLKSWLKIDVKIVVVGLYHKMSYKL
jgi:hypothetical protein